MLEQFVCRNEQAVSHYWSSVNVLDNQSLLDNSYNRFLEMLLKITDTTENKTSSCVAVTLRGDYITFTATVFYKYCCSYYVYVQRSSPAARKSKMLRL